jgi:hypothetical protein
VGKAGGYLKDHARDFRLDVQPPLPYSRRVRRVAPQLHAMFGCNLAPCEEMLQAAERELLEESCCTLAERHLHPLQSAIGRLLLRGPQLQGGEGRLMRNLSLRMCPVPASGLRGPLFGTFAPRHIRRTVLAMLDGDVSGGVLRSDIAGYRGKSPARRDERDVLYNVLVSRAVYLLPVHGSGKKEHGLTPFPFGPVHGARAAYRNWNTCNKDIFGT